VPNDLLSRTFRLDNRQKANCQNIPAVAHNPVICLTCPFCWQHPEVTKEILTTTTCASHSICAS